MHSFGETSIINKIKCSNKIQQTQYPYKPMTCIWQLDYTKIWIGRFDKSNETQMSS